jgi:hypothetical protein
MNIMLVGMFSNILSNLDDGIPFMEAVEKGVKVVSSCQTLDQLSTAERFVNRVRICYSDLFIIEEYNVLFNKLKTYLKAQKIIINEGVIE